VLAALLLPVAAVCFVVGLVLILERPGTRTISLDGRPSSRSSRSSRSDRPMLPARAIPSARAMRSVGDEAEEWLHQQP
jgi:hypothetical protein